MRRSKILFVVTALMVMLSITTLSAQSPAVSQPLSAAAQAQVEGGVTCGGAVGLGAGLAVGALSPCSIICAVGAWYSIALIAYAC